MVRHKVELLTDFLTRCGPERSIDVDDAGIDSFGCCVFGELTTSQYVLTHSCVGYASCPPLLRKHAIIYKATQRIPLLPP